jgi:hypothetical protein
MGLKLMKMCNNQRLSRACIVHLVIKEAIALIEPKLCIHHWKVLYKLCVFYVDRNSKMTTTAEHSFYIGPIVFFYNQVNDTGS